MHGSVFHTQETRKTGTMPGSRFQGLNTPSHSVKAGCSRSDQPAVSRSHTAAGGLPSHYHHHARRRLLPVFRAAMALLALCLSGCTYARWTGPGGETLSLIRVGLDTKIGRVEANVRNGTVAAEDYDAQAKLAETIRLLVEGMK